MNRDPGLQPERTALAWRRTALSMFVNGALLVRAAAEAGSPALWAASVLIVLASATVYVVGRYRRRALTSGSPQRSLHAGVAALLLGTVWLAAAASLL